MHVPPLLFRSISNSKLTITMSKLNWTDLKKCLQDDDLAPIDIRKVYEPLKTVMNDWRVAHQRLNGGRRPSLTVAANYCLLHGHKRMLKDIAAFNAEAEKRESQTAIV